MYSLNASFLKHTSIFKRCINLAFIAFTLMAIGCNSIAPVVEPPPLTVAPDKPPQDEPYKQEDDLDGDGVADEADNCPDQSNSD